VAIWRIVCPGPLERNGAGGVAPQAAGESSVKLAAPVRQGVKAKARPKGLNTRLRAARRGGEGGVAT
jgi:hypothetical protein